MISCAQIIRSGGGGMANGGRADRPAGPCPRSLAVAATVPGSGPDSVTLVRIRGEAAAYFLGPGVVKALGSASTPGMSAPAYPLEYQVCLPQQVFRLGGMADGCGAAAQVRQRVSLAQGTANRAGQFKGPLVPGRNCRPARHRGYISNSGLAMARSRGRTAP